jgi:hypothetical protein
VLLGQPEPDDVFFARIFRGIANGTLERVLLEYIRAEMGEKARGWRLGTSTSWLFDSTRLAGVPSVLLTGSLDDLDESVSGDTRARVREDIAAGHWVVPRARGFT